MVKFFIRNLSKDRLGYQVARWFRISLALFSVVVIGGTIAAAEGARVHWFSFPMVLAYFSLFAACYTESWVFDRNSGTITHAYGLLFYTRRAEYPVDGLTSLRLQKVRKGGFLAMLFKAHKRIQLSLQLVYGNRDPVVIEEISQWRSGGQSETAAAEIAEFLQLPLETTGPDH